MREDDENESNCTSLFEITKKMTNVEDELFLSSAYLISYQRNVVYNNSVNVRINNSTYNKNDTVLFERKKK